MRVCFKWLLFAMVIVCFFTTAPLLLLIPHPIYRREKQIALTRWHAKQLLRLFGVRLSWHGVRQGAINSTVIVSNHLSYLDALILMQFHPSVFVTSVEVKYTPFLGWICRLGGCYFVERRKRLSVSSEAEPLTDLLVQGFNIVLFPEGTSSNGDRVLPFKTSLFNCAIRAKVETQPVCLIYRSVDGLKLEPRNRDSVYWYGDMTFFPHLRQLMRRKNIKVDIYVSDLLVHSQFPDRKTLGGEAHSRINDLFQTN